jgi:acyl carrier protein
MSTNDEREQLLGKLSAYTERELLDGKELEEFTTTTPLLEWGLLNSIETARLVAYIREEFGVRVPPTEMVGRNFQNLESIADMVRSLRETAATTP